MRGEAPKTSSSCDGLVPPLPPGARGSNFMGSFHTDPKDGFNCRFSFVVRIACDRLLNLSRLPPPPNLIWMGCLLYPASVGHSQIIHP